MSLRVFACLGADLDANGLRLAAEAQRAGQTLLALDSSAIGTLSIAGLAPTVYDDWLDTTRRRRMHEVRRQCEDGWFAAGSAHMTVDGVCWPEIDKVMMSGFWEEHVLQLALAEAFLAADVEHLTFFRSSGSRPSLHRSPSDTFGATWPVALRGRLRLEVHQRRSRGVPSATSFARRVAARGQRTMAALREAGVRLPRANDLIGRAIVAVGEDEAARFEPLVRQLARERPGEVAAFVLEPDRATALRRGAAWDLPVLPGPGYSPVVPHETFERGLDAIRRAAGGEPWHTALEACPFQFAYFARNRWPRLVSVLRGWERHWTQLSPRLVIVSSLEDARSQLPALAAARVGARSVAVPHAPFYVKAQPVLGSDVLLYETALQRDAFAAVGVPRERLRPHRSPGAAGRAASRSGATGRKGDVFRLLALTNPVSEDHPSRAIVDPWVGHRDQLRAFEILAAPPDDLRERVVLWIKPHPLHPDLRLAAAAHPAIQRAHVPRDADLREELARADLVVGVNYVGSALSLVAAAGKPLVHLWTSPLLSQESTNPYAPLVAGQGALAGDHATFWTIVRSAQAGDPPQPIDHALFELPESDAASAGTIADFMTPVAPSVHTDGARREADEAR